MAARSRWIVIAAVLVTLSAGRAHGAAVFMFSTPDAPGMGFNSLAAPDVASTVGGNAAPTLGGQRTAAFIYAMGLWGTRLTSGVTINVSGTFTPLACTPVSGTLGSAGPTAIGSFGVPMGPLPVPAFTLTTIAEAEQLAGANLNGAGVEIAASFNVDVGTGGCLAASSWYYGFDQLPPPGGIDFVTVLLHELGHGLGFRGIL